MSKFGTSRVEANNPSFGSNPAVASEKCYHLFLAWIFWQGDEVSSDGTGKFRSALIAEDFRLFFILPNFGGSIAKVCFCETEEKIELLKKALKNIFPASSNLKPQSVGDTAIVMGYELTERDCRCGFWTDDCKGNEEFELLDHGGDPMKHSQGFWITSTGDTRQFPSNNKEDILQDVINTELTNSLPCCKKKSSSSSTSLGN